MEDPASRNPFGSPVYRYGRVSSTMEKARGLAAEGCPHGTVAMADFQESGRGRIPGRTWSAEPGSALLCTTVLRFSSFAAVPPALTLRVGLAAAEAIEEVGAFPPDRIKLKWPNDVLAESGGPAPSSALKLCGILCESDGAAVYVGAGFNIAQKDFPPEISRKATSIFRETGTAPGRDVLLEAYLRKLGAVLGDPGDGWRIRLEQRLFRRGERVRFEAGAADSGAIVAGILVGIGTGGELLIRTGEDAEPKAFASGELKLYDDRL